MRVREFGTTRLLLGAREWRNLAILESWGPNYPHLSSSAIGSKPTQSASLCRAPKYALIKVACFHSVAYRTSVRLAARSNGDHSTGAVCRD